MEERSTINEYDERIFEGSITKLVKEVGASSTYYGPIRQLLDSPHHDPCIILYRRGSAGHVSIVRLMHPPPQEWGEIPPVRLTRQGKGATLRELESRVEKLEARWRESTDTEGRESAEEQDGNGDN